jgi:hypothetical protein
MVQQMNVLTEFVLTSTANLFEVTCGIDTLEHCKDDVHYRAYAKNIIYAYNKCGYRDEEWPTELNNNIWCVGDSFTSGLGQPQDETWAKLVEKHVGERTINVSMNGASNDWIARRVQAIIDNFSPSIILIQWSYCHRRENKDVTLTDESRRIHFVDPIGVREKFADMQQLDKLNCIANILNIKSQESTQVVHSFVPKFARPDDAEFIYDELTKHNINFFPEQLQVDFARDGFHYDILTASNYAILYVNNLKI